MRRLSPRASSQRTLSVIQKVRGPSHDARTLALLDDLETDLEAETSAIEASSRGAEDDGLTEPKFEAKPQPSRFVLERRQAVWPVATPAGPRHRITASGCDE